MVLPFQLNLIKAQDAYNQGDLDAASKFASAFLVDLENSEFASEIRRQHNQKETFYPNFVSSLIPQKLDAFFILAECQKARGKLAEALEYCHDQLSLFDQHYGRDSSNLDNLELRIPGHAELREPFSRTAWCFSTVYTLMQDMKMAERWERLGAAAGADEAEPDATWERWLCQQETKDLAASDPPFPDFSWTISEREDERIRIKVDLANHVDPRVCNHLVTLRIKTRSLIPTRAELWELWAIRNGADNLVAPNTAVLFCETQVPGARSFHFYTDSPDKTCRALQKLIAGVKSHTMELTSEPDPRWLCFKNFGGPSIHIPSDSDVQPPVFPEQSEVNEQTVIAAIWQALLPVQDVWTKFYNLLWNTNLCPPDNPPLLAQCVDYISGLLEYLNGTSQAEGLMHLVWKGSAIAPQRAIEAFDRLLDSELLPGSNPSTMCLAAEELAKIDPRRALKLIDALNGYELAYKPALSAAQSLFKEDPAEAARILQKYWQQASEEKFAWRILIEVARAAAIIDRELGKEAMVAAVEKAKQQAGSAYYTWNAISECLPVAQESYPELLEMVCNSAVDSGRAVADKHTANEFFSPAGVEYAVYCLCDLLPLINGYDPAMARSVLIEAFDLAEESGEAAERIGRIQRVCTAAQSLDAQLASERAAPVWDDLLDNPVADIEMFDTNQRIIVAVELLSILAQSPAQFPAQQALARFADTLPLPEQKCQFWCECSRLCQDEIQSKAFLSEAISAARAGSGDFVKAIGLGRVALAMKKHSQSKMDATIDEAITLASGIKHAVTRYQALLALALRMQATYPARAEKIISDLCIEIDNLDFQPREALANEDLKQSAAAVIRFRWIMRMDDNSLIVMELSRLAQTLIDNRKQDLKRDCV